MKNLEGNHIETTSTRENILQAAAKLFATTGYHQTSLRALTQEAGVNIAAVNYHFRTKEGLLHILIRQEVKLLQANFLAKLEALEVSHKGLKAPDILECLARALLQKPGATDQGDLRFLSILGCDPDKKIQKICREPLNLFYGQVLILLRPTLPHLSEKSIHWRFNFFLGALTRTVWMLNTESDSELTFEKDPDFIEMRVVLTRLFE